MRRTFYVFVKTHQASLECLWSSQTPESCLSRFGRTGSGSEQRVWSFPDLQRFSRESFRFRWQRHYLRCGGLRSCKNVSTFCHPSWCLTLAGSWGWLSPGCPGSWCRWRGRPQPGPRRWSWPWGRGWEEAGNEAASPWSGGRHPGNKVMPVTVFTL